VPAILKAGSEFFDTRAQSGRAQKCQSGNPKLRNIRTSNDNNSTTLRPVPAVSQYQAGQATSQASLFEISQKTPYVDFEQNPALSYAKSLGVNASFDTRTACLAR